MSHRTVTILTAAAAALAILGGGAPAGADHPDCCRPDGVALAAGSSVDPVPCQVAGLLKVTRQLRTHM